MGGRSTQWYWNLAAAIDILHMPLVIGFVLLGASWWSGPIFYGLLTLLVVLQVATLGCPVMALTGWLRRKHDPDYEIQWSFTAWLYRTYGRWVGIAVFVFFAALAVALRIWLF